ncbi:MAG: hypothetical protein IJE18_08125 [Bacteroidaceae bacterium]|nr:hypothetical protein [Bacteroidales bacterium]MBQ2980056.1 hypothetical protein [Bacteroidaceae bacterium]
MGTATIQKVKFDIPDVSNYVPRRLKPWIFIAFVLIFQLSGGVYLAAASNMVGATALMHQDIMMAGYASLIGMSLNFAVMFRLKFRFSLRTSLKTCSVALIICNLICLHTTSVPLLVATCFVAGWFRMWGTFACNTTIQLWITPKRDMAEWFCFIYLIVQGSMQLDGIAIVYTTFWTSWRYIHWLVIGLLSLIFLLTTILIHHHRSMPKLPLFGIDWLGSLLWGAFMMCIVFICLYGDHYDWWQSVHIRTATLFAIVALCINIWRMRFLRHPYIAPMVWKNRIIIKTTLLYLFIDFLVSTEHVFEHTFSEAILGYDSVNAISLNWYVLIGVLFSCIFCYEVFAKRRWSFKTMTIIGFTFAAIYLAYFYFFIDYNLEKETLFIPLFFRGAAVVTCSICFLTAISQAGLPFPNFAQALTINGFASAVLGSTVGPAILGEIFERTMTKNAMLIGSSMTAVNTQATHIPLEQLYGMVQQHALIVSMKEVFGWLLIIALFVIVLLLIIATDTIRPSAIHPKWSTIRKGFKNSLKIYRRLPIPFVRQRLNTLNQDNDE